MRDIEEQLAYVDVRVELLAQFSLQRGGVGFSRVDLSAWKLPHAGKVNAVLSSRDEERILLLDDGCDDNHARESVGKDTQCRRIGQSAQRGFRAEHTVAPKSISA